jgi:hypothetical protein
MSWLKIIAYPQRGSENDRAGGGAYGCRCAVFDSFITDRGFYTLPYAFWGERAMKSTNPIDAAASAHDVMELLPKDPAEAEATLDMVKNALAHPGQQPDQWSGPASYVFSHLRKRAPEDATAIIDAARVIIRAERS